jgi:hypothetical protein
MARTSPMIKGIRAPPFNSTTDWPPLKSLISDEANGIIGDVQFLLDLAIVASPKTGTTEQMLYLADHPEIQMHKQELHILTHHTPAMLVKALYNLPHGRQYKRGYKSPHELERKFFTRYYRKYWPNTKLIIGLRRPVKWFESHYNSVTRMGNKLAPAEMFVGADFKHTTVKYHEHLAKLGMTNMSDPNEYTLLNQTSAPLDGNPPRMTNPIFLYDVSQFFDSNATRVAQYRSDLQTFLGLQEPLYPYQNDRHGSKGADYHYAIVICESRYNRLRRELVEMGTNASKWIQTYFLHLANVHVSSPNHFCELLVTMESRSM